MHDDLRLELDVDFPHAFEAQGTVEAFRVDAGVGLEGAYSRSLRGVLASKVDGSSDTAPRWVPFCGRQLSLAPSQLSCPGGDGSTGMM